jgi:hypothetical protein
MRRDSSIMKSLHGLAYAARALGAAVAIFGVLMAYAVAHYPGGTWADHTTRGFDPLHNFICDLLEPVALDGEANGRAAHAAIAAVVVLAFGLALTWALLPALFPAQARLGFAVRRLGLLSFAGILAVPLVTAKSWYSCHAAVVLFAGVFGLAAAALAVVGLGRTEGTRAMAWVGGFVIAVVLVDVVLYGHQLVVVGKPSIWLSLLEGVATVALLVWLSCIAVGWNRAGSAGRGR